ncbi:glycosyltransferase [Providencia manganoxydans]|uniref:glycosyltransferase n=1 Tax=Providencia manganoxydans TaxID=2923283 RepID=UPI0032DA8461
MKKIAFIITGLGMGGAEMQVCSLADKLSKLENKVVIISLSGNSLMNISDDIQLFEMEMRKNIFGFIKTLIRVRKILSKFKPDIVHSHMYHANIFSRLLAIIYPIPVLITTAHSSNEGGELRMFTYRITDFLSTISTNVSSEAVDSFIKKKAVKKNRMITMYNGIDTLLFNYNKSNRISKRLEIGISEQTFLILSVGRLTPAKDYPNLLYAFSKIKSKQDIQLAIIGEGELKDDLINLSNQLNISHKIHWLGLKHDVNQWMSACDIFILSSAWEGFGLVVAEAMSCERLVIGTNSGGVQEVINEFGIVVPTKDSEALANAIDKCISLPSQEKEVLQKKSREHIVNNFSLDEICFQWVSFYEKLLESK